MQPGMPKNAENTHIMSRELPVLIQNFTSATSLSLLAKRFLHYDLMNFSQIDICGSTVHPRAPQNVV
jgi:hypothetical protein